MVAVTARGASGALRASLAAVWAGALRGVGRAGRRVVSALLGVAAALLAARAVAGLALVAYGAWLAWPPAGFIVAGAGLLADRASEELRARSTQ